MPSAQQNEQEADQQKGQAGQGVLEPDDLVVCRNDAHGDCAKFYTPFVSSTPGTQGPAGSPGRLSPIFIGIVVLEALVILGLYLAGKHFGS
jgi:hypothetical protein